MIPVPRTALRAFLLAASLCAASVVAAQPYPSKPVRIVVAAAPGGGTPEQLYEQIRKELDQWRQVIVRAGIRIN